MEVDIDDQNESESRILFLLQDCIPFCGIMFLSPGFYHVIKIPQQDQDTTHTHNQSFIIRARMMAVMVMMIMIMTMLLMMMDDDDDYGDNFNDPSTRPRSLSA